MCVRSNGWLNDQFINSLQSDAHSYISDAQKPDNPNSEMGHNPGL